MFSIFSQKKSTSKDRRLTAEEYKELNEDVGDLVADGMSEEAVVYSITDLDCMNPDLDDSCAAAAAAAPATFDDGDMVKE